MPLNIAAYLVGTVFCLLIFVGIRYIMFKGLSYHNIDARTKRLCSILGGARDMMFVQAGFGLTLGFILTARAFGLKGAATSVVFGFLFACYLALIVLLNILDGILFVETNRRLDSVALNNITPVSILGVLTRPQLIAAGGTAAAVIAIALATWRFTESILTSLLTENGMPLWLLPTVWFVVGGGFILGATMTWHVRISEKEASRFVTHSNNWVARRFALFLSEELNLVSIPVLLNFIRLFHRREVWKKFQNMPLTTEEHDILQKIGLEPTDRVERLPITPQKYSRIILLSIESLGLQYIAKYNDRLPYETTPFLSYLCKKFHTLENYYTSMLPTDLGLTAILASRLDDTWLRESTRHETILSVLKKYGYATCMLRNVDIHYDNHHKKIPAVYKADRLIGGETLEKEFPNAVRNNWGICDAALYQKALNLLREYEESNQPVVLVINTMDTHPGYWWNPRTRFPQIIEKIPSRALRSLYQMDSDLSVFFSSLMEQGFFDDETLLLIFGDHCPCFGPEYKELTGLVETYNKTPLIFVTRNPNPFQSIARNRFACQLDLLPTLCEGMGLPVPSSAIGNSLFETWVERRICGRVNGILIESPHDQIMVNMETIATDPRQLAVQKWLARRMAI